MSAYSGQKIVTTAGIEVQLGDQRIIGPLMVKALATNTGTIYIGNAGDGTVSSTTGYELAKGETITFFWVGDIGSIWIDSSVNGDGVCWHILNL